MPILRRLQALGLLAILFPSLALGSDFNKFAPFNTTDFSQYTGKQIFEAAYQAYVCSFLMHLAGQKEKAQLLRYYSVKLMQEDSVKTYGKGWNDVNFPGALSASILVNEYSQKFNVLQSSAATKLLDVVPQCKLLNRYLEDALIRGGKKPTPQQNVQKFSSDHPSAKSAK